MQFSKFNINIKTKEKKSKKIHNTLPTIKDIVSNDFVIKNYEIEGSPLMLLDEKQNNNNNTDNNKSNNKQQNHTGLSSPVQIENLICGNNTHLDENELTIWYMSHNFNYNTKNKKWPTHTKIHCWNDGEPFDGVPIMIPRNVDILIEEFSNFEGVFCNVGCALRWLKDQGSTDIPMRIMKFGIFISKVLKLDLRNMRVAYPKIMLQKFGGNLSIENYREDYKSYKQDISQVDHLFLPAILLFEIDRKITNDASSDNNISLGEQYPNQKEQQQHSQVYDFETDIYKNPKDQKICVFNTPLWVLKNDHKKMDFELYDHDDFLKKQQQQQNYNEREGFYDDDDDNNNNDNNDDYEEDNNNYDNDELLYDLKKND